MERSARIRAGVKGTAEMSEKEMQARADAAAEKARTAEVSPLFDARNALNSETQSASVSTREWVETKLAAIYSAGSFEAINALMEETGLTPAESLLGRTLVINDFGLVESAEAYKAAGKSALDKWAVVKAVDPDTGEDFVIDGGGDQFVMGLVRMRDLYGFPFTGNLLGKATGTGNTLHYWRFHDPKRPPKS